MNRQDRAEKLINPHIWRISIVLLACILIYYIPVLAAVAGNAPVEFFLLRLHNLWGLDFYAMIFFAPVAYAAYVLGIRGAMITTGIAMLAMLPYSLMVAPYPNAISRPIGFALILSAIGASIAILQEGDEERRRNTRELKCLYDIGRAAEKSGGIQRFLAAVVEIIPGVMPYPRAVKVRALWKDIVVESPGFHACRNHITQELLISGEAAGSIEVHLPYHSPSLKKQGFLMKTVAERVSGAVQTLQLEASLHEYYEQLETTVEERTRDLKQAQERLRLLSNTVKSATDGIVLADMEGNITFANEASSRLWGYAADEITRMRLPRLYPAEARPPVETEVIPVAKSGPWSGELMALGKNGRAFPVQVTISPVRDEDGKTLAIVAVHRDITETKTMQDKLLRSEKLAAVGELASGVGHELRNPLNVIRNCVYLLDVSLNGHADEDVSRALHVLNQQVDIANKIITDLLDFTRVRAPSPVRLELIGLIKEALSWQTIPQEVSVNIGAKGDSPVVLADAEQIGRAFTNIIANAVQAMSSQGELRINTGIEGGFAWSRFEDNGCGISEGQMDRLFEPLFTTKPRGVGLGLAISKRLIEQNSGTIEVESSAGKGAAFTVRLPLVAGEEVVNAAA